MSKFKITPHDTKEYHCRHALKAFDPSCVITIDKEDLVVETTKLDLLTIKSFTSVKEVIDIDKFIISWDPSVLNISGSVNPGKNWATISGSGNWSGNTVLNNNTILNSNPNNTSY